MTTEIQPVWNYADFSQVAAASTTEFSVKRDLRHELFESWGCSMSEYPGKEKVLSSMKSSYSSIMVVDFGIGIAKVLVENGSVSATAYGRKREDAAWIVGRIREYMPAMEVREGMIPVTFWYWGQHGPDNNVRMIPVPGWEEIKNNYPPTTRSLVAELMEKRIDIDGGQLVLWQGEPGTGKTFALRSLMDAWRDWSDFHFIVDPDTFFGDHTDYMMQVLLHKEGGSDSAPWNHRGNPSPRNHKEDDERWKILVLEDSGELLATDARDRVGQGLSRLLNVVDGIIGQGLRVIILVTTNEELRQLHPAIQRPGRCASRITFAGFSIEEARQWLIDHDGDPAMATKQTNISWLYAAIHGLTTEEESTLGFGLIGAGQ